MSRRFHLPALAFAFAAALSMPIAAPAFGQEDSVVATVNGEPITEADITLAESNLDQQFSRLPQEQRRAAALSALIEIRLLAARAEEGGVADDPQFQRELDFLRLRALHSAFVDREVAAAVTDEAVRARYEEEMAKVEPAEEVRARHILVETREEAEAVIARLDAGEAFEDVAEEISTDGSAQNGGDLGYFGRGQMVPEFEQVAFELEVGSYTKEPVQSQFGWHVIKVEDKRTQEPPAFEQVESQVRSLMLREKYFEIVASARAAAEIDVTDPELAKALDALDGARAPAPEGAPAEEDAQSE